MSVAARRWGPDPFRYKSRWLWVLAFARTTWGGLRQIRRAAINFKHPRNASFGLPFAGPIFYGGRSAREAREHDNYITSKA